MKKRILDVTLGELIRKCGEMEKCTDCEFKLSDIGRCVLADHNYPSDWDFDDTEKEVEV